jgi:glyoxylase-like metal-dependent hydrolase (beta-lactamase superfamily II)
VVRAGGINDMALSQRTLEVKTDMTGRRFWLEGVMLGETRQLAGNLWYIEGLMPDDFTQDVDRANALVYRAGDRLYVLDTGSGEAMRQSLEKLINDAGPLKSLTILNSHSHLDHCGNNDLVHSGRAEQRNHYISKEALDRMDLAELFVYYFTNIEQYYEPLDGYVAYRQKMKVAKLLRDILALFIGRKRAWSKILTPFWKNMENDNLSRETMQSLENLPLYAIHIGETEWRGWILGEDDVWVLEDRSHTPDEVLFYIPEHRTIYMSDATFHLIPTFSESNSYYARKVFRKVLSAARSGDVKLLVDGHTHEVFRGADEITAYLGGILSDHEQFRGVLNEILQKEDGLTIGEIYSRLEQYRGVPAVIKFLALDFPVTPTSLWICILYSVLEMGYEPRGRKGHKRFYRRIRSPEICSSGLFRRCGLSLYRFYRRTRSTEICSVHGYYCECDTPQSRRSEESASHTT